MLSVRTTIIPERGVEVIAWHERTLVVTTPTILRAPVGSEWIILRARVPAPLPEDVGLLVMAIEAAPGEVILPRPKIAGEACHKCAGTGRFAAYTPCLRCAGTGKEPLLAPPMYEAHEVTLPEQRCKLAVSALARAEQRLNEVDKITEDRVSHGVKSIRKIIDYFGEAARGQPTVEMVRAFTEAVGLAQAAWHAYVEEVSPAMVPLHVRATKHAQRVRIEHREMMFGGETGGALGPLLVELTFLEKNESESVNVPLCEESTT
jgi:hypothetical protein